MFAPPVIKTDSQVGEGLTGTVYKVSDDYLAYIRTEANLQDDVNCVSKIVEPSQAKPGADDYYEMTDVRDEIVFNTLVCAKDKTLAVPIIHWVIFYTDRKDGERSIMNSRGADRDLFLNEMYNPRSNIVKGEVNGNLKTDICWTFDDLNQLTRPLTQSEKQDGTTVIRALISMPLYDGDLKTLMRTHAKPSFAIRYRMCIDMMNLMLRLHKGCKVLHGDNHEKNILYKMTEEEGLIFRLHDFGRARNFDKCKDRDISFDLGRLGAVCLSIIVWRQVWGMYDNLAQPDFDYTKAEDPMIIEMLKKLKHSWPRGTLRTGVYLEWLRDTYDKDRLQRDEVADGRIILEKETDEDEEGTGMASFS